MIPVIDLFAGPGGLGEGFSSLKNSDGTLFYKLCLSIEKDKNAHSTLELRSFFRKFPEGEVPEEYYKYLRHEGVTKEELFAKYPREADQARSEAWLYELCEDHKSEIDKRIAESLKGKKDWVLLGGPPCQAYSMIGRARMRGSDPKKFEKDIRHSLYKEYLRILITHKPSVFIMENVKGILTSRLKGELIFKRILQDLSYCNGDSISEYNLYPMVVRSPDGKYSHHDYIIRSEQHNIPQTRHRIIILGIRKDINATPIYLKKEAYIPTLKDAICDLPKVRSSISRNGDSYEEWKRCVESCLPILASMKSTPFDIYSEMWESCNYRKNISLGSEFVSEYSAGEKSAWMKNHLWWFEDKRLTGYCNHIAKSHMKEDLTRYFFLSCYARVRGKSPLMRDIPDELRPVHNNLSKAVSSVRLFSDRFKVQMESSPASTIMSHLSKDGHYFIHPDPVQCRSLTVREAARIQTFPDNYLFEGNRTSQYTQVGNAVPPLLARQIAEVIKDLFEQSGM